MKIGFVGLGKMGANMVVRLINGGHSVVGFAPSESSRKKVEEYGAETSASLSELVSRLNENSKVIWLMVPAGKITEDTISELNGLLKKGDVVIDGGNSFYKDSIRRAELLEKKGIDFLDVGTSGGIWGLKEGYCLMIGGKKDVFNNVEPLFKALTSSTDGYGYIGPNGAGHFVKMVHNGIEYGMLQAYAEGFEIINSKKEFNVDLGKLSKLWNNQSVVRSWLLELAEDAFSKSPNLNDVKGYIEDSGEGRWTVAEAISEDVPAPIITLSLLERLHSRQTESFSAKVIAALRNEFGGHAVRKS